MLTNTERWYKGIRRKLEELKHSDYWDSIQLTETEKRIVKKVSVCKSILNVPFDISEEQIYRTIMFIEQKLEIAKEDAQLER